MLRLLLPILLLALLGLLLLQWWPQPGTVPEPGRDPEPTVPAAVPHAIAHGTPAVVATDALDLAQVAGRTAAPPGSPQTELVVLVVGAEGAPRPDLLVVVAPQPCADRWLQETTARTDADGKATFHLDAGVHRCRTLVGGATTVAFGPGEHATATIELPADGEVRGQVVDADGAPVAGAQILAIDATMAARGLPLCRCDADGKFLVAHAAAAMVLVAVHDEFAPSAPVHVTPAAVAAPITFVLTRTFGRCRGVVLDAAGAAVPNAMVLVGRDQQRVAAADGRATAAPMQQLTTDADGRFASGPLPPGPIAVLARAEGMGLASQTAVLATDAPLDVVLRLHRGAAVRGVARDPQGRPVAGAFVWNAPLRAFGCRIATTAADGSYRLDALAPGAAWMSAQQPGSPPTSTELQLADDATSYWDPVLATVAAGAVRGRVVDRNDQPLAGWHIVATVADSNSGAAADTDAEGHFAILGIARGAPVTVTVRRPESGVTGFPDATEAATADGPELLIRIGDLEATRGCILGRIVDADGKGLGAQLRLSHPAHPHLALYRTPDDGRFELEGLPLGTVQLEILAAGHARLLLPDLTVTPHGHLDVGTVRLARGGLVFGRVTSATGDTPATELRIVGKDRREAGTIEWTADGYRSPLLAPGEYALLVRAEGFACTRVPVTIAADVQQQVDLVLRTGMPHRIAVATREPSQQSAMTSIMVFDRDGEPVLYAHLPMTAGAAEFQLTLDPGSYTVAALGIDNYRASARFTVDPAGGAATAARTEVELQPH